MKVSDDPVKLFAGMLGVAAIVSAVLGTGMAFQSFETLSNGQVSATANSASYQNTAVVGQPCTGVSTSYSNRNYAGLLSAMALVRDGSIAFTDESPVSSTIQTSPALTAAITVGTSAGGNNIVSVKYCVSSTGPDNLSAFTDVGVSTDTVIDERHTRFKVSFPNASGLNFAMGDNNYIQWWAKNDAGDWAISSVYRVRVQGSSGGGKIAILQPSANGTAASLPIIQARLDGVNPQGIVIRIDNRDGSLYDIIYSTGLADSMYDNVRNIISYRYTGTPLRGGRTYRLTVSGYGWDGTPLFTETAFTVKDTAIADVIPYPSPFDPKVRPVKLRYLLNTPATVSINIYDMSGRLVRNVVNGVSRDAGTSEDIWNGSDYSGEELANGIYICEVSATDGSGEHRFFKPLAILGK